MINVLVVDDSATARSEIARILESDADIKVIGSADDGAEAVKMAERMAPDVITMDVLMPNMDGFEATRQILQCHAIPIIIVSSSSRLDHAQKTFQALEAGAVAVLSKPASREDDGLAQELIRMVKLMAEVKVVTRRYPRQNGTPLSCSPPSSFAEPLKDDKICLIAIGASAGGPQAIEAILTLLKKPIPLPILIAQHIASGFVEGLCRWLSEKSGAPVFTATHGQEIHAGRIYLAPDGHHLGVSSDGRCRLSPAKDKLSACPSVAHLFQSVSQAYQHRAIGVLLSGMGKDGAEQLHAMRQQGALTIAQDEQSALIFGMPGEAVKLGGAQYVLSPEAIAMRLDKIMADNE